MHWFIFRTGENKKVIEAGSLSHMVHLYIYWTMIFIIAKNKPHNEIHIMNTTMDIVTYL